MNGPARLTAWFLLNLSKKGGSLSVGGRAAEKAA